MIPIAFPNKPLDLNRVTQISCALADKIQAELVVFESIADLATS
jgi:hypothetical protein